MTEDTSRVRLAEIAARVEAATDSLSIEARAVAGAWFGMMVPGKGELTFSLRENKPTAKTQAALDELVRAGLVSVEAFNRYGGLVYRPLVRMDAALKWLSKNTSNPAVKFRLIEPVANEKDARAHQRAALRAKAAGEDA